MPTNDNLQKREWTLRLPCPLFSLEPPGDLLLVCPPPPAVLQLGTPVTRLHAQSLVPPSPVAPLLGFPGSSDRSLSGFGTAAQSPFYGWATGDSGCFQVRAASRGVQPVTHGPHTAQDGYNSGPIQNCKFTGNIMKLFL